MSQMTTGGADMQNLSILSIVDLLFTPRSDKRMFIHPYTHKLHCDKINIAICNHQADCPYLWSLCLTIYGLLM